MPFVARDRHELGTWHANIARYRGRVSVRVSEHVIWNQRRVAAEDIAAYVLKLPELADRGWLIDHTAASGRHVQVNVRRPTALQAMAEAIKR